MYDPVTQTVLTAPLQFIAALLQPQLKIHTAAVDRRHVMSFLARR